MTVFVVERESSDGYYSFPEPIAGVFAAKPTAEHHLKKLGFKFSVPENEWDSTKPWSKDITEPRWWYQQTKEKGDDNILMVFATINSFEVL
jgi:hypothetical protein